MPRGGRLGAGLAVLLLATGCDLTLPWSAGSALPSSAASQLDAPQSLTISPGGAAEFDVVYLSWSTTLLYERYELQWRVGAAGWQGADGWMTLGPTHGSVALDAAVPENTPIAFRLRGTLAGRSSDWSDEVAFVRGIRPPTSLSATLLPGPVVALAWSNASAVADELRVERAQADGFGGPVGPWSTLPVAFGPTSYADTTPPELVQVAYRARYGKDGSWSQAALVSAGPVPLRAPEVAAAVVPEGVRLTWANRSTAATSFQVRRWPDGTAGIATLAADADMHVDPTIPVWPSSRWAVVATAGTSQSDALWIGLAPYEVSGPAGTLRASTAPVRDSLAIRRSGDGQFVHLGANADGSLDVVRQTQGGDVRQPLSIRQLIAPYLELDGPGRPHVLGYDLPVSGPISLVHEWAGDSGWMREALAEPPGLGSSTQWGVDATGRVLLLSGESLCTPSAGVWDCEAVPDPPGMTGWMDWRLTVSRDGTALLAGTYLSGSSTVISIATLPPGGAFEVENAPLDCGNNAAPRLLPDAGGDFGMLCHRSSPSSPPGVMDVHYAERRGGAWSALEPVGAQTSFTSFGGAATPGLSRVHVWASQGGIPTTGLELWSRTQDGWAGSALVPSGGMQQLMGHLDSGNVWLVAKPADHSFPVPAEPFSLWEEP
jgi:hypothetical protein